MNLFFRGFRAIIPITTGVIPFGAVMGTVFANAKITFFQAISMNLLVYAGAAQLAAVDLMKSDAAIAVVVVTGLIINLRFLLYSAALAPIVKDSRFLTKLVSAYCITDQTYATMSAHQNILKTNADSIRFYMGASVCMFLAWQLSVIAGYIFGNFAPEAWALDYAVPLSFVALLMPTLKNKKYVYVAVFSAAVSLLLSALPYKVGLIITALLAIFFGVLLTQKKVKR